MTGDPRRPRRVLVVDADPATAGRLTGPLAAAGYRLQVESVSREPAGGRTVPFDVLIAQAGSLEPEDFRLLARSNADAYRIVSLRVDEAATIDRWMAAGADDVLFLPLDPASVLFRLAAAERIVRLRRDLESKSETLLEANARLEQANSRLREELRAAARVQQALLPAPGFAAPGVQLAWQLRPCDELAGDLLNCVRVDEKHLGFYVLDVCGHGVSSALQSVQVSRLMSPMMAESSLLKERLDQPPWYRLVEPQRVAERLNEMFQVGAGGGKYFTLVYGLMQLESGLVRLVSAGHPGPVRVPRGGSPRSVPLRGHPVGLFDEADFASHAFVLEPGERIWFYSDGIVDAMNDEEQTFGLEGLERRLDAQRDSPLSDAVAGVMEAVERWTGASGPGDDCTLLVLER